MDLESDLGIDSIKRVEILAAVEEAIPGLTKIPPDRLGSLRTVSEILVAFGIDASGASAAPAAVAPQGDVSGQLLKVVADKTGYPVDMLNLSMDMEADLGIDSIKRVEILAAPPAWLAPGERPRLGRNGWFCGKDARCGVCAAFEPAAGPATLVGFTPHPDARGGFRFVVARGQLTPRRFPETGTVNGAFRFLDGSVEEAWARWAAAGVNHHSSATPGDISADVERLARLLGVEAVTI